MKRIIFILIFLSNSAISANIGFGYIFGEELNGTCGLTNAATEAAIATILRQNRINVRSESGGISFYYQITPVDLGNSCAVNVGLQVISYADVLLPLSPPKKIFSKIELCGNNYILSGPKYDLQTRVSGAVRELTETCINTISKR